MTSVLFYLVYEKHGISCRSELFELAKVKSHVTIITVDFNKRHSENVDVTEIFCVH